MKYEDIEKQFDDWYKFINVSSITIGFLSAITALSVESIPLLALSFFVFIVYIQYHRKEKFPKLIAELRLIKDKDSEFIECIRREAEKKFSVIEMIKNGPIYWLMACIYVVGLVILLFCPSFLIWH